MENNSGCLAKVVTLFSNAEEMGSSNETNLSSKNGLRVADGGVARDTGTPPPVGVENPWHNTRKMVYVKTNPKTNIPSGFWPIPESFWTDLNASNLVSLFCC